MAERPFGPYMLVRQIAVGGMAEIHLAKTSGIAGFEKYVALKMIHPNFSQDRQFIQMLIDEAKITVHLQHVNIAQTFDLGRVGTTYYITMEYVDGADLYKLLRRGSENNTDVPIPVAAHIAKEVATGLDHAHRKRDVTGQPLGIVHRDVSPQNVLISHAGEVKLVDFGIAKATMRARQTAVGVIKGKYYYMSPEQAWGDPLDHRTDVFSAGILLYEMLTGQMLYLEEDLHKLLDMVRKAVIASPTTLRKDVPPQLERIVMHCLQKKPEDRYQTAGDLAADLQRFLHAYAPVFTATKVAAWSAGVLGDALPPPQAAAVREDLDARRITREQIVAARNELTDENSVIFRVADLKPPPEPGDVTQPALVSSGVVSVRGASVPAAAAIRGETRKQPEPISAPAIRGETRKQAEPIARPQTPAPAAESVIRRPVQRRATSLPRDGSIATQQLDVHAVPQVTGSFPLDDIEERTEISGPPGFAFGHEFEDATVPDQRRNPVPAHDTVQLDPNDIVLQTVADDVDEDGPTLASPATDSDATNVRQNRAPERKSDPINDWEHLPALVAANPTPAVSIIRPPRQSRKTPAEGIQTRPERSEHSVLTSLLESGRPPQVAISPPPRKPKHDASAFPPPRESQYQQLPLAPKTAHTPTAFGLPSGVPPSTAVRFAAIELDEIPDRFKINQSRSPWLLWGGVALLAALVGLAAIAFSFREKAPEVAPASIEVSSNPANATVLIDDKKLDNKTPTLFIDAKPGKTYLLVVDLEGYQRWQKEVHVADDGGNLKVFARLDKIVVSLTVKSEPAGAQVYINGNLVGNAPLTLDGLDPTAPTVVELRKSGYRPVRHHLEWGRETERALEIRLEK